MKLTITGTIKEILLQLQGMEAFYGSQELFCSIIINEKGDNKNE